MRLPPLPTIREIIRIYKLSAHKQLSQNFLLDLNVCKKIVRKAGNLMDQYVCEVGSGPGGITRAILEAGVKELAVIEKDRRFMPGLQLLNEASGDKIKIHHGDVLRFNMDNIFPNHLRTAWDSDSPDIHIIGNLPFSVSTPLIIQWLQEISNQSGAWTYGRVKLTLTFQKEVAKRIVAPILKRERCRLSVMCQYLCHVKHSFTIPGKAFQPSPDVDVGVVTFIPRVKPLIEAPFPVVEKVARHTFHYRQKMCKRGLQTLFPPELFPLLVELVESADVDPEARPYMLSVRDFQNICKVYHKLCYEHAGLFEYDYRSRTNAPLWQKARKSLTF